MADEKTTVAKKATKKAVKKTVKKPVVTKVAKKTVVVKKAVKKPAVKKAPAQAEKTSKQSTDTPQGKKPESNKPEFDFKSTAKSAPQSEPSHLDKAVEHAQKSLDELVVAAIYGGEYLSDKFDDVAEQMDNAYAAAKKEAKVAVAVGRALAKEHPVLASLAASAAVSLATTALKLLFRKR